MEVLPDPEGAVMIISLWAVGICKERKEMPNDRRLPIFINHKQKLTAQA